MEILLVISIVSTIGCTLFFALWQMAQQQIRHKDYDNKMKHKLIQELIEKLRNKK